MSKFPPEVIYKIIRNCKDDKKSLYSFLFVSRDWCRDAIRLLWRKPFHFLYVCSSSTSCHCSTEKLQYQTANLLINYLSLNYNDDLFEDGSIKTKGENIMFNYLEFLRVLNLRELCSAIKEWNSLDYNRSDIKEFLNIKLDIPPFMDSIDSIEFSCRYMFEFLFTNSPKLISLSSDTEFINSCLSLKNFVDFDIVNELFIGEPRTLKIKQVFGSLSELVITIDGLSTNKTLLLFYLSQNCHNIQKLSIRVKLPPKIPCERMYIANKTKTTQLVTLIRSQNNLVHFELFDTFHGSTSDILEALGDTQCNSLKVLVLNRVFICDNNTILFHLKYLQNLQELRFNKCVYVKAIEERESDWEDLWLPKLNYLEVDFVEKKHKYLSKELISNLLECSPLITKKLITSDSV